MKNGAAGVVGNHNIGLEPGAESISVTLADLRVLIALPRFGDFSSNWITSGLPTTRTSALTLYAS